MPRAKNPLSIEVLGDLDSDRLSEDIQAISDQIELELGGREHWLANLREIRRLIDGTQERKNKPWKGASNVCIPLIKKLIRRWKPLLYNLYALADPVCSFNATTVEGMDQAPTAEAFFHWLVTVFMDDTDENIQYLTEYIGRDGSGYLGVSWDFRTDLDSRVLNVDNIFPSGLPNSPDEVKKVIAQQYDIDLNYPDVDAMLDEASAKILQGAKFVRVTYQKVISNKPKIVAYDPAHVIVPAHSGQTHDADFVAISHQFTDNELRKKARDGFFREDAVEDLLSKDKDTVATSNKTNTGEYSSEDRMREIGIYVDDEQHNIYQVFCWVDWNNDGIKERTVMWMTKDTNAPIVLAMFPYSLSIPYWPVFRFDFEKTSPKPYISQGIGHLIQSLQEQINKQYRAKSDAIDIQLAPVFQRRISGGLRSRNIRWGPGKVIDVQEVGDIAPVEKSPFNLHEYINSEAQIENYADTTVGSLINDLQATGRKLERRTATEVQNVSQTSEAMSSMDSASFQSSMRLVWQTVWQMWLDFGPREIYFTVTGERTPVLFKKADYDKNYQLMPTGTPGNTDRNRQLSMTMQLIEMALQDPTRSFNIPVLIRRAVQLIDHRMENVALVPEAQKIAQQTLEHAAALINAGDLPPDVQGMMTSGADNLENQARGGGGGAL